jgi:4-diphosphocytidyl-2C-methyl-D-erythritol kinase
LLEKSEDTKEVFSSRKLKKEKQNNDQAKNGKETNNDLQNITQKTRTSLKPWVNSGAPEG